MQKWKFLHPSMLLCYCELSEVMQSYSFLHSRNFFCLFFPDSSFISVCLVIIIHKSKQWGAARICCFLGATMVFIDDWCSENKWQFLT